MSTAHWSNVLVVYYLRVIFSYFVSSKETTNKICFIVFMDIFTSNVTIKLEENKGSKCQITDTSKVSKKQN